jgi:L-2,4-diaminobutyrate decarboxylase
MDSEFKAERAGLERALGLLLDRSSLVPSGLTLPAELPEFGIGSIAALDRLAPAVLGGAADLAAPTAMAHMDPPTPWITWATTLWNAALNQNLLHPATAPIARHAEQRVLEWIAPLFGMSGGHMLPGSTLANVTALWAARECAGVTTVVVSDSAHVSIPKAANLLGLQLRMLPTTRDGTLVPASLPDDLSRSALVLTAGTTSTGGIDDLALTGKAAWTHVDAAWAGPLRLSGRHRAMLDGIETADSVAVSAHKWLFQPKESALVMFRDTQRAHQALSFGGAYLAAPNIGILGSHGAVAVPLLATLLAWGRQGLAERIERCMEMSERLTLFIKADDRLELLAPPQTGVVVWRPVDGRTAEQLHASLPPGSASLTTLAGVNWLRSVAANPNLDVEMLLDAITRGLEGGR